MKQASHGNSKHPPLRALREPERRLVEENTGLAYAEARRVAGAIVAYKYQKSPYSEQALLKQLTEELLDAAMIGLCAAAQRWDKQIAEERGCKFSSYAHHTVRSFVNIACDVCELRIGPRRRSDSKTPYKVALTFSNCTLPHQGGSALSALPIPSRDKEATPEDFSDSIESLLHSTLQDERQYRLIKGCILEGKTHREVGEKESPQITRQRVKQILDQAMAKLHKSRGFLATLLRTVDEQQKRRQPDEGFVALIA